MNNSHTTQSYKIPLKGCRDSIIDHPLVTIQLSMEWAPRAGDEPNLVISITNKTPTVPHIPPNSSPICTNSPQHQTLSGIPPTDYQQLDMNILQPRTRTAVLERSTDHSPPSLSSSSSSASSTTTVVRNAHPMPSQSVQSSLAIEKIKADLQNHMSTYHDAIQTPPNSIENIRHEMNVLAQNSTFGIKPMSTIVSPDYNLQHSPTHLHNTQRPFLCNCPNPINHHLPNCPINAMNQVEFYPINTTTQLKPVLSRPHTTNTLNSSSVTSINYPQPAVNPSHVIINKPSSFQKSLRMTIITPEQINKTQRKVPYRRKNSTKSESKDSEISSAPSLQTGTVPFSNNYQKTDNSKNDTKSTFIPIRSPLTTMDVRSPVELDIPLEESIDQTKLTHSAVEQIIEEVVQGRGDVTTEIQPTKKPAPSSQARWQSNGMKHTVIDSSLDRQSPSTIQDIENTTKRIRLDSLKNFNNTNFAELQQQSSILTDDTPNQLVFDSDSHIEVLHPEPIQSMNLDDILKEQDEIFSASTPLPLSFSAAHHSTNSVHIDELLTQIPASVFDRTNKSNIYDFSLPPPSISTWETNQISSSTISTQHYSQTEIYTETNRQTQIFKVSSMNINKTTKSSKIIKAKTRLNAKKTQTKCTRCGRTNLIDITSHEFPKKKGLVFECTGCGNNSIQSNISAEERRQRLAKVAVDHLNTVQCQFCQRICHSHYEYIVHLKDDHQSNKPVKNS